MAETDRDPLGLAQHEREVSRHAGHPSEVVERHPNVAGPGAQRTPQPLHFELVIVSILHTPQEVGGDRIRGGWGIYFYYDWRSSP